MRNGKTSKNIDNEIDDKISKSDQVSPNHIDDGNREKQSDETLSDK